MDYKTIYSTFSPQDTAFIKSMFEANNIDYRTNNEWSGGAIFSSGIHIMVKDTQIEQAMDLIKDFERNTKSHNEED